MQAQEAVSEASVGETGADPVSMVKVKMSQKSDRFQAFPGAFPIYLGE
jgi:hypothetical protein